MAQPSAAQGNAGQQRRWRLWMLLCLLVALMLGTLVFLAQQYEQARGLAVLEEEAAEVASDIHSGLLRNVQTLQSLHSSHSSPEDWQAAAAAVLSQHRELVRLEWRGNDLELEAERDSAYHPLLFDQMRRPEAMSNVRQACDAASRLSAPAYASSYFWPVAHGIGLELMDMCLPLSIAAQPVGFLVATYTLQGVLAELTNRDSLRGKTVALTEVDGTRLSVHGGALTRRPSVHASQLLDLPGQALMVRLESARVVPGLFPNVLTAVVGTLSLALLAVLALLARDMRRRMKAEGDLAEALAFRSAMENSLITGLRARDMQGRITYVNPAFCQMVGLQPEDLVGKGLPSPYWPPELVDEYRQRHAVRLSTEGLPREGFESVFMRADGTRFPVLIIEAPLVNALGQQTGWMSAVLDLSEQRRIEELSRASQERLQATARLAMVGEMASLLSHELNQPLAAMASYATGALNLLNAPRDDHATTPIDGDLRQAMQRISEQAERAGRVIKSVADLVRRREHVREAVAPRELLDAIMPLLSLQARKLAIRVVTDVPADCPDALCDRTMVEQVLLNLARNGMQAMSEGQPGAGSGPRTLTIRVSPPRVTSDQPGARRKWLAFSVTDHGVGLSDAVAEKIFTPFFTTKSEGMGLGLSLCRTVIEQHGGALTFEPAEPTGTTFRFTLPAASAADAPAPTAAQPATA